MSKKALERAEASWEPFAEDVLPASYPDIDWHVVRGPLSPALAPLWVRFLMFESVTGSRPVSSALDAAFGSWLRASVDGADDAASDALAARIVSEIEPGESLVVALVGGSCDRRITHYTAWVPDHTWAISVPWETRLKLEYTADGAPGYRKLLDEVVEWTVLPDFFAVYNSVLVACPEADVASGQWLRYADGSKGSPMPVLQLGSMEDGEELFWTSGACDARSPILRELDLTGGHVFAIESGPSGFVRIARPDEVSWGSRFLDQLDDLAIARQQQVMTAENWSDVDQAYIRLRRLAPKLREFYDRAYQMDYWIVHFAFLRERPELPDDYTFRLP